MFSQESTTLKKLRRENALLCSSSSHAFHPGCCWYQCSIMLAARCAARTMQKKHIGALMVSYEENMYFIETKSN